MNVLGSSRLISTERQAHKGLNIFGSSWLLGAIIIFNFKEGPKPTPFLVQFFLNILSIQLF